MGALQAGASMKGEFENRLKMVIEEVQSSPKPIILFIDEAHQLMGAGGVGGDGGRGELPGCRGAWAQGTLRTKWRRPLGMNTRSILRRIRRWCGGSR